MITTGVNGEQARMSIFKATLLELLLSSATTLFSSIRSVVYHCHSGRVNVKSRKLKTKNRTNMVDKQLLCIDRIANHL